MIEDAPKTIVWFLWAVLAVALIEASRLAGGTGFGYILMFAAAISGFAAAVEAVYWAAYRFVARWRVIREATTLTERVRIFEIISKMSEPQLRYLENANPTVSVLPGSQGPVGFELRTAGWTVPYEFIHQFMDMSDGAYLAPVGSWNEGSKQRVWAQLMTEHFTSQGFAERAAGNHSARWVNRAAAEEWLGIGQVYDL